MLGLFTDPEWKSLVEKYGKPGVTDSVRMEELIAEGVENWSPPKRNEFWFRVKEKIKSLLRLFPDADSVIERMEKEEFWARTGKTPVEGERYSSDYTDEVMERLRTRLEEAQKEKQTAKKFSGKWNRADYQIKIIEKELARGDAERARDAANELNDLLRLPRLANTFREAQEATAEFVNKPLLNNQTSISAIVTKSNVGKMLHSKAAQKSISGRAHSMAVANADHLFAVSRLGSEGPDKKNDPNKGQVRRFYAPMLVDGQVLNVKITVMEIKSNPAWNSLYTVEAMEVEMPALLAPESGIEGVNDAEGSAPTLSAGTDVSVLDWIRNIKESVEDTPRYQIRINGKSFSETLDDFAAGKAPDAVGRPELANPGKTLEQRQFVNLVDENRAPVAPQTFRQWDDIADAMIENDRQGTIDEIIHAGEGGIAPSGEQEAVYVRAGQKLARELIDEAYAGDMDTPEGREAALNAVRFVNAYRHMRTAAGDS